MIKFVYIILIVFTFGLLIYLYFKDRRARAKRTVQNIGDALWEDIKKERDDEVEKGIRFRKALEEELQRSKIED